MKQAHSALPASAIIAKNGLSAIFEIVILALLSFLTSYCLVLSVSANNLSENWNSALVNEASLWIPSSSSNPDEEAALALEILKSTKGITRFEEITQDAQSTLLRPWLGEEISGESLLLPKFYAVEIDRDQFQETAFLARLKSEAPSARWDNHSEWRKAIENAANRIGFIALFSVILIILTQFLVAIIMARFAVISNAQAIRIVLDLGADQRWIIRGFLSQSLKRSLMASLIGVGIASLIIAFFIAPALTHSALASEFPLNRSYLLAIGLVVLVFTVINLLLSYLTINRYLERIN